MKRILVSIAFAALLATAFPAVAGELAGEMEWRYGEFSAYDHDRKTIDASHFTQQYSLLYSQSGELKGGRLGAYDFVLGAEWRSVDRSVDSTLPGFGGRLGDDVDIFKPLHRGRLLIAPGGLPFRLELYSRDLNRTLLSSGNISPYAILEDGLVSEILDGEAVETGATLMVGIRNGSYMGRYRETLSNLPRLLLDYRQLRVRDLKSLTQENYLQREFAFVSLNKKDNWFHFRQTEFKDYLNSGEDFTQTSYQLGTIDHQLQRQWINMTNWIKVSVDGTYTKYVQAQNGGDDVRRYDLNLFSVAKRPQVTASTFSNFSRVRDKNSLEKNLELPFFLTADLSRDTSLRLRLIGVREEETLDVLQDQNSLNDLFLSARVEAGRRARLIFAPQVELELKRGSRGEGAGGRVEIEAYSNKLYRPRYDLFASLSAGYVQGTSLDGSDLEYAEQSLLGRIETDVTTSFRTGLQQELVLGQGTLDISASDHLDFRGNAQNALALGDRDIESDLFRSISLWFGEYRSRKRLDNRIEMEYDHLSSADDTQYLWRLRHHLSYRGRKAWASWRNEATHGDSSSGVLTATGGDASRFTISDGVQSTFSSDVSLNYSPTRVYEADLGGRFDWHSEQGTRWSARQGLRYNLFSGFSRRLAVLEEQTEYERFTNAAGGEETAVRFTLIGSYFPLKVLFLTARFEYELLQEDVDQLEYYLTAGLDFQKLKVALDYSYGTRTSDSSDLDQKEHRWEMKVQKTF